MSILAKLFSIFGRIPGIPNGLDAQRAFDASKLLSSDPYWTPVNTGPNHGSELGWNRLLARVRHLEQSCPWVPRAQTVYRNNFVGTGIRPDFDSGSDKIDSLLAEMWEEWATEVADVSGDSNFYGLQGQAVEAMTLSGMAMFKIIRRRSEFGWIPFQLQAFEVDHLAVDYLSQNSAFNSGFLLDSEGTRTKAGIYKYHPLENSLSNNPVIFTPMEDLILMYRKLRPGQLLGWTWFYAVMQKLKLLDDFDDAVLKRQRLAGSITGFIESQGPVTSEVEQVNQQARNRASSGPIQTEVRPGFLHRLKRNETMKLNNTPDPIQHETFTRATLRSISMGLSICYESLSGDLSNVNYSSARIGWLEFQRFISDTQEQVIIHQFNRRVMKEFKRYIQYRQVAKDFKVKWIKPRREMIDIVAETDSLVKSLESGLKPISYAWMELGYDPDTVLKALESDRDKFTGVPQIASWMLPQTQPQQIGAN